MSSNSLTPLPPDTPTDTSSDTSPDTPLSTLVETLLRDPRGQFRPRAVVLCALQPGGAEQVVMQVGEDALGRVQLLTAEPLSDGVEYGLCGDGTSSEFPTQVYVLDSTREGRRPEDATTTCWVNTLTPLRVALPQEGYLP